MNSAKTRYHYCFSAYLTCAALTGKTMHNLTFVHQSSSTINPAAREPEPVRRSSMNLSPCVTEIFYIDYMPWLTFRDLFTTIYTNNLRPTPVEKLCHLDHKTCEKVPISQ